MKTSPSLASLLALHIAVLINIVTPLAANPVRPVTELIEQLSKTAGRAPARGATEALEQAFRREGAAALDAARRGGLGLPEAAARHGDDVFRFAVRVPEAAPALAARADDLLPLARRHGDDFLKLEARIPGLGDDAVQLYPSGGDLRRLTALPPDEARTVVSYAAHATDAKAPRLLLDAVVRGGGEVLRQLDAKKILALGLSSAMVIAASGGAVAVASAPESFIDTLQALGLPVSSATAIVILACGAVLALALAKRLNVSSRKTENPVRTQAD